MENNKENEAKNKAQDDGRELIEISEEEINQKVKEWNGWNGDGEFPFTLEHSDSIFNADIGDILRYIFLDSKEEEKRAEEGIDKIRGFNTRITVMDIEDDIEIQSLKHLQCVVKKALKGDGKREIEEYIIGVDVQKQNLPDDAWWVLSRSRYWEWELCKEEHPNNAVHELNKDFEFPDTEIIVKED